MGNEAKAFTFKNEFSALIAALQGGYSYHTSDLDDTNLVLLSTSLIDQYLRFSLLINFRNEPSKAVFEKVFSGHGPLASFAGKIAVCEAFGIVYGDMAHDLKIIRDVRNKYAHSPNRLYLKSFQSCLSLKMDAGRKSSHECAERRKFTDSATGIMNHLSVSICGTIAEQTILARYREELKVEAALFIKSLYEESGQQNQ